MHLGPVTDYIAPPPLDRRKCESAGVRSEIAEVGQSAQFGESSRVNPESLRSVRSPPLPRDDEERELPPRKVDAQESVHAC